GAIASSKIAELNAFDTGDLAEGSNLYYTQARFDSALAAKDTGDLAEIDPDGHIRIVGRLKDLIVNSGGDNIAPAPIEQEISLYPEVEQVVVVGDARPWLSAIICLSEEIELARRDAAVHAILKRYNQNKSPLMQVRKAVLMDEPCSIENGLLTPTQKVKRKQVIAQYEPQIAALYSLKSSE
ncbi:MAG: long-chain fatty acid--CoA ligase, partial [Gammaproteobacteria bacterium]|nr:long-chain fatty acid--CoA ligase [Gammaproteobacteria bacterium]